MLRLSVSKIYGSLCVIIIIIIIMISQGSKIAVRLEKSYKKYPFVVLRLNEIIGAYFIF